MPKFVRVPGIDYPIPIPKELQDAPHSVLNRWVAANKDAWLSAPEDFMSGLRGFGADVTETAGLAQREATGGTGLHELAQSQREAIGAAAPRLGVIDSFGYGAGEGISRLADVAQQSLGYMTPALAASVASPAAGIGALYAGHVGSNVDESVNAGVDYQDVNALRAAGTAIPQTALDYALGIGLLRGVKLPKTAMGRATSREFTGANPLPARTFNPYTDLAKRTSLTGLYEGTSEAGQDALAMAQAGLDPFDEQGRERLTESALAGAVLGGGLGAVHNEQPGVKAKSIDTEVAKRITQEFKKTPETAGRAINPENLDNVQGLLDEDLARVRDAYVDLAQTRAKVLSTSAQEHIASRLNTIADEMQRRTPPAQPAPVSPETAAFAPEGPPPADPTQPTPGTGIAAINPAGTDVATTTAPETSLVRSVSGDVLPPETTPVAGALPAPSTLIDQAPLALPPGSGALYGTPQGEILPQYAGYNPPTEPTKPTRAPVHGLRVDDNYDQPNIQRDLFGYDRFNPMTPAEQPAPVAPVVNPKQVDAFTQTGRPSAAGIKAAGPATPVAPKAPEALAPVAKPQIETTPEVKAAINEQVDIGDGVEDIDDAHESVNDPEVSNQYRQRAAKFIDRWNAAYAEANPQVAKNQIEAARQRAKAARDAERMANKPVSDAMGITPENADTAPRTSSDMGDQLSDQINNQGTVDDTKYSRGNTGSSTVNSVADELTKLLGTDATRLMRNGRILLHDTTPSDIPSNARAWFEAGSVHIVPGRIPASDIRGVLLHELGVHGGMRTVFGKGVYEEIRTKMRKDPDVKRIYERALNAQDRGPDAGGMSADEYLSGTADPIIEEEAMGYYVEQLAKRPTGLWQRIKNAVKQYIASLFKISVRSLDMTDADILAVVQGAAKAWARDNGPDGSGGSRMYSRAATAQSKREAAARAKGKPAADAPLAEQALYTFNSAKQAMNNAFVDRGTLYDRLMNATSSYSYSVERKLRDKLRMYLPEHDAAMAVSALDQKRNADQYIIQSLHDGILRVSAGTQGKAARGTVDPNAERAAGQAYIEKSDTTVANLVSMAQSAADKYGIDYHSFSNLFSQYANSLRAQSMLRRASALTAEAQQLNADKAKLEADHKAMTAHNRAIDKRLTAITNTLASKTSLTPEERLALRDEAKALRAQRIDAVGFTKANDAEIDTINGKLATLQKAINSQESIATKPFSQATVDYNNANGTSYTPEQYTEMVSQKLIAQYPELEAMRKLNREILRQDNKLRYDAHLVDKATYEANDAEEYYTSWLRDMAEDGDEDLVSAKVKAPQKVASQYDNYHLNKHGSHREIGDTIENTMLAHNRLVHRALGNIAARAMVRDLSSPDVQGIRPSAYSDMSYVPEDEKGNTVSITENGKPKLFVLNDANDVSAFMGPQRIHSAFVTLMAKMAQPIRSSIILDPAFILNQPLQDAISAAIATGTDTPLKLVTDTLRSIPKNLSNAFLGEDSLDPTIERLNREGGITGRIDHNTGAFEAAFNNIGATGQGLLSRSWGNIKEGGKRLERMAAASDVTVRARIYDDTYAAMIKTGKTPVEANLDAMDAANNIINFRKVGAHPVVNMMIAMIPFFNAQLQSLAVVMQVASGKTLRPQERQAAYRQLLRTTTKLATMAMIYAMATADNDAIANKSDEERMRNFFIPLPNGDLVRVPVRSEFGWLWKFGPEQMMRSMLRQGEADATLGATAKGLLNGFRAAYVPQGGHLGNFLPAGIKPLFELYTNKSTFNDMPITPESMKDLPASEQWDDMTGEVATLIGRNTGISPKQLDHLLRSYTGGVAIYANTLAYGLMKAATNDNRADKSIYQMPFFKSFTSSPDGTKAQKQFYEAVSEARGLAQSYKKALADGRYEDARKYKRQISDMTIKAEKINDAVKRMQQLNEALRVNRSSSASPERKRLIERSIQQQIDALAGRTLKR